MATSKSSKQAEGTPLLEVVASGLGALFAVVIIAFLAWDGLTASTPADITVEAGEPHRTQGGYAVPFKARNHGGEAAAQVDVVGRLLDDNTELERSEMTFDFVPGKSERRGVMIFSADPRNSRLDIRVTGHQEP